MRPIFFQAAERPEANHYKRLNHQTKHNDVELAKSNILLIGPRRIAGNHSQRLVAFSPAEAGH